MQKGQNIAGYPIGIIYIEDIWYPLLPGNIVNGSTFSFPVRLAPVKGLTAEALFNKKKGVYEAIYAACKQLQREGVRAISGACGFFGNYQEQIRSDFDIPVALSSLVQLPWIAGLLKPDEKIGVLTADSKSFTPFLLRSCGIDEKLEKRLVVMGMEDTKEFSCVIKNFGHFHVGHACQELVDRAKDLLHTGEPIGAILLECSDMPPFAAEVQREVRLPVWDFTTLINWLYLGTVRHPFSGII